MGHPKRMGGYPPQEMDETPVEIPIGLSRPTPLQDIIAKMVRQAVEAERGEEFETPEESDDFEPEDENLMDFSPYELQDTAEEFILDDPSSDPTPIQETHSAASQAPQEQTGDTPDQNVSEPDR